MRILLVEDEPKMARLVRRALSERGDVVDVATTGEDAVAQAGLADYDAVLLDVRLPGIDGYETCRRMRAGGTWTPVLMLTARTTVEDRVAGLDAGADDYLAKPFALAELLARLRAVVRREPVPRPAVLVVGDLELDPATRRVTRAGQEVRLSTRETALLEALMRRPEQVLTRDQLLERVWDMAYDCRSNVVDVYVRYLRDKVDRPFGRHSVQTVRGLGYRLSARDA